MELRDLVGQVSDFDAANPGEKIRLFAWWLHTHCSLAVFTTGDIKGCYEQLHLPVPNIAMYLTRMKESKRPKAMRKGDNYHLTRDARTDLDAKHGIHHSVVAVNKILTDLPAQVPNIAERAFLQEALKCYRHEAYRACIVMAWNIAYAHLLDWILTDQARLDKFNAAISRRYQNLKNLQITKYDDFGDSLQERQVLEIANTADLYNSGIFKILKDKLDRRNTAAHPSTVVFVQSQADDMVTDLVNNVVLALN
jgi:hypothetical protein